LFKFRCHHEVHEGHEGKNLIISYLSLFIFVLFVFFVVNKKFVIDQKMATDGIEECLVV